MMLLLVGCPKSGTEPPKEPGALGSPDTSPDTDENGKPLVRIEDSPAKTAEDIVLDGFRLGDSYAELIKRTPYQDPCDDDPVDAEKTTRAMVYGGLPCRGQTFADGTTLVVFLPFEEPDVFNKPIEAVVWLGGSYFNERSNFGLKIGADRSAVSETLGKPTGRFVILDPLELVVEFYRGDQFVIFDGDVAAGFAIGSMPKELRATDEHWEGVAQMYSRYTTRVASESGASEREANCDALITKAEALMRAEPKHVAEADELVANRNAALAKCVGKLTPDGYRCSMAATTYSDFGECYRKHKR